MVNTHHRNKVQDQLLKGLIGLGLPTGNLVLLMVPGQIGTQHRGRCPCWSPHHI